MTKRIKRRIVKVENYKDIYCPPDSKGRNILHLECGHRTSRKGSVKIPVWVYCWNCERYSYTCPKCGQPGIPSAILNMCTSCANQERGFV